MGTTTLLRILSSDRLAAGSLVGLPAASVEIALVLLFMLFLMRLLARRDWLAAVLFTLFNVAMNVPGDWQTAVSSLLIYGLYAVAMMRYGLVMLASALLILYGLQIFPVTLNFTSWYAGAGLVPLVLLLALAVFAFYTSLGGLKVFAGKLLED